MQKVSSCSAALALVLAGCGGLSEDRIELKGRQYVLLADTKVAIQLVEEMFKSHAAGRKLGHFESRFDDYIRYVNIEPGGTGRITFSLDELGPEQFRGNPDTQARKGCDVVYLDIHGFRLGEMRCSPEG